MSATNPADKTLFISHHQTISRPFSLHIAWFCAKDLRIQPYVNRIPMNNSRILPIPFQFFYDSPLSESRFKINDYDRQIPINGKIFWQDIGNNITNRLRRGFSDGAANSIKGKTPILPGKIGLSNAALNSHICHSDEWGENLRDFMFFWRRTKFNCMLLLLTRETFEFKNCISV